jgi:hypothetical protein
LIFAQLQQAVAGVPNNDAYFTTSPGCRVYWQGEKELETGKPLETAKAIQQALSDIGVSAVVPEPSIDVLENTYAVASVTILFLENISENRGEKGTHKTAYEFAAKALGLLWGESFAPWSALVFQGLDPVEIDGEGCIAWALKFRCQTLLDNIETLLATESGALLITEAGAPLLITPTDP